MGGKVCAVAISSNDFKPGVFIEVDGAPYRILGACPATDGGAHGGVTR